MHSATKRQKGSNENMAQQQSATKEHTRYKKPRMYEVIVYNDDVTTMDFVVDMLTHIFNKSENEAEALMLHIHNHGQATVGVYTYDIARTKVQLATAAAQEKGFPLRLVYKAQ